jgi:aspartokinase-like uncharacterized kinase
MWVVKLGGSLASDGRLTRWLEALSRETVVLVPGGGPFADQVRAAQTRWGLDDQTAHDMAILGMRQYGRMLMGLCPELQAYAFPTLSGRGEKPPAQGAAVWLPQPETLNGAGIPASWDITSDSLAAWFAKEMGALNLLLVKSAKPLDAPAEIACSSLIEQGFVDPAFRGHALASSLQCWLCGPDDHTRLRLGLGNPADSFLRIRARGDG